MEKTRKTEGGEQKEGTETKRNRADREENIRRGHLKKEKERQWKGTHKETERKRERGSTIVFKNMSTLVFW